MRDVRTNCPNCGAPIIGDKCGYCGTEFDFHKSEYEKLISYRYNQLTTKQNILEVQLAMAKMSNYIKEQQLKIGFSLGVKSREI